VSATDAASTLDALRAVVEAALDRALPPETAWPATIHRAVRYSLFAGGKRIRPVLVLAAGETVGGVREELLPFACAVEMVHTYSLIHDDLPAMDDDDLRRGLPTCHKQFGEALAILAGDALLALAFEVVARHVGPPQVAAACCAALAEAAGPCRLVGGQADDLAPPADVTLEALESIHHRKTGAMIEVSLRLGGLVAGADDPSMDALRQYGRAVGLAFQITDDLLDVRGTEATLGKRVAKDRARGKLTFPGLLGIDESLRRAGQLVEAACRALRPLGDRAAGLESLARYVLERNR
jgi:geranylgeranyl diphosphate synthase type II